VDDGLLASRVFAMAVDRYSTGKGLAVGVGARLEQPALRHTSIKVERTSQDLRIITIKWFSSRSLSPEIYKP